MSFREFTQDVPFSLKGQWWVQGGNIRQNGELKYDVTDAHLHLNGALHAARGRGWMSEPEEMSPAVIHGLSRDGDKVTLLKSWYLSWQPPPIGSSEISESTLLTHVILINGHYDEAQRFASCNVHFPEIERWYDFEYTNQDKPGNTFTSFSVTATSPEGQQYKTPIGDVGSWCSMSLRGGGYAPLTIQPTEYLFIAPSEPMSVAWYLRQLTDLQRLFSLFFGVPVHSNTVALLVPERDESDGPELDAITGALLFTRHKRFNSNSESPFFVFPHRMIAGQLGELLSNWFAAMPTLQHALNLYFASLYQPGQFLEERFGPTVKALEVLTREMFRDKVVQDEAFDKKRQEIRKLLSNDCDQELAKAIDQAIGYANSLNLRDRIIKAIERLETQTVELFCLDHRNFSKGIVDTRNHHTHYSSGERLVLQGADLHWATVKVRLLVNILLLKHIGLSEQIIRDALKNHYATNSERKQWSHASELGTKQRANDETWL